MTYKKLILATFLFSTSLHAMAVEWNSIIKKDDYETLVDIDSYNVENGFPYILTKTIFIKKQSINSGNKHINYLYHIKKTFFNCHQPQFKVASVSFYNQKNKLLISDKSVSQFTPIIKDSDEYLVGQLVCQVNQMVGGQ